MHHDDMQYKIVQGSAIEVKDAVKGHVRAVIATTDTIDADGEVFLRGAFGSRSVRVSSYNHRSWPQRGGDPPVGRGEITERRGEVHADLRFFMGTTAGREAFEVVKEMGDLQEWSYGFRLSLARLGELPEALAKQGARRAYAAIKVEEVSPVFLGASVGTRTLAVKAADGDGGEFIDPMDLAKDPAFVRAMKEAIEAVDDDDIDDGAADDGTKDDDDAGDAAPENPSADDIAAEVARSEAVVAAARRLGGGGAGGTGA